MKKKVDNKNFREKQRKLEQINKRKVFLKDWKSLGYAFFVFCQT